MAVGRYKCPGCSFYFKLEEEEYILVKKRHWHKKCYDDYVAEKEASKTDEDKLTEYICELFKTNAPGARINRQIKDMIEKYEYTHSGILGSLKYWYEVKGESLEKANGGIGIVPFIYNDARKYYEGIAKAHESNKIYSEIPLDINEVIIKINPPKVKKKSFYVDLDLIEECVDGEE